VIGAWLLAAAWAGPARFAVVIGADRGAPGELDLLYAEQDAERVATVLEDLGGFAPEDVVRVRGQGAERVRAVLREVGARVERRRSDADTLLVVYYSGHGGTDGLHLAGSVLPLDELKGAIEQIPADLRLLVVDACQAGELTRRKGGVPVEPFEIRALDRIDSEGLAIITSSSPGEDAQESDRLRGGVFSHHLVAGMLGAADASGDGRVTLSEAYRYGYAETLRSTSDARLVQHPTYAFDLRGRDDIVLTTVGPTDHTGLVALERAGTYLVFSSRGGQVHAEITVPDGATVALPPGSYVFRRRGADEVREATVEVIRGGTVALSGSALVGVPYGTTVRRGLADRRRAAVAITAGGGAVGATVAGADPGPVGALGVRVDLEPLSVGVVARYARQGFANEALTADQDLAGLDLELVKRIDVRRLAPGVGVRLGGDLVWQRFTTAGIAADRRGLTGRLGPWLGAELALASRLALSVAGGADGAVHEVDDGLAARVVPWARAEVVLHVR
jgi:hypothetical protein